MADISSIHGSTKTASCVNYFYTNRLHEVKVTATITLPLSELISSLTDYGEYCV